MRLSEWIDRLRSETDLEVKTAADLAALRRNHRRDTVYVMYSSDDARSNEADVVGAVRQLHTVGVDLVYAITNLRTELGGAAVAEIEQVRETVLGALVGWQPPSGDSAITYRRGRVLGFQDGEMLWQDSFEAEEYRVSR